MCLTRKSCTKGIETEGTISKVVIVLAISSDMLAKKVRYESTTGSQIERRSFFAREEPFVCLNSGDGLVFFLTMVISISYLDFAQNNQGFKRFQKCLKPLLDKGRQGV